LVGVVAFLQLIGSVAAGDRQLLGLGNEHLQVFLMGGGLLISEVYGVVEAVAFRRLRQLGETIIQAVPVLFTEVGWSFDVEHLIFDEVAELVGIEVEVFSELVYDCELALLVDVYSRGNLDRVAEELVQACSLETPIERDLMEESFGGGELDAPVVDIVRLQDGLVSKDELNCWAELIQLKRSVVGESAAHPR